MRVGLPHSGHTTCTFEAWSDASRFAMPPLMFFPGFGFVCRLMKSAPATEAIRALSLIVTYAMAINVFFILMEVFTAFYSQIPGHMAVVIRVPMPSRGTAPGANRRSALATSRVTAANAFCEGMFSDKLPSANA